MGTYVYFSLGDIDGIQTQMLADAQAFSEWLVPLAEEYPGEYPPAMVSKVSEIARHGGRVLNASTREEAHLIDRVVDEYWNFCDIQGLHRDKDVTPSAHKRYRYAEELRDVVPKVSKSAEHHYRTLFGGRSLTHFPDHTYQSEDGVFYMSWLLPHEAMELQLELEKYEAQLRHEDDSEAGVLWILRSLEEATQQGRSLVVVTA